MQLPFRMVRRTWMSGCWHTVGSNSHNYSFAGYCYLPKKLALCVLTCNTCFKDSVCHIALFVMHSADANFMHWFCGLHAFLPYYKKKKKKGILLKFPFHSSAVFLFCFCLICMNGSPDSSGNPRMKTKIYRRDSEAMPVLHTEIQLNIIYHRWQNTEILHYTYLSFTICKHSHCSDFIPSFFWHTYAYQLHSHEYSVVCKCWSKYCTAGT